MSGGDRRPPLPDSDAAMGRLLRLAGPRPGVADERAHRVREAVRARWESGVKRRAGRRRALAAAAWLAAAAGVILALRLQIDRGTAPVSPAAAIATVDRIDGSSGLRAGDRVSANAWVETGPATRVALRLAGATSIRLDTDSRMRFLSPTVLELTAGAVYLDTGRDAAGFEVRTPLGTAHDIGTQFTIGVRDRALTLRVRTGLVELRSSAGMVPARAGSEVRLDGGAAVTRTIPTFGPDWDWTAVVAPAFEIEGRSVAAFLEHYAHEHGWTLHYADAALARDASSIILHGSVAGLQAYDALAVALATSGLTHRFQDGELVVSRSRPPA